MNHCLLLTTLIFAAGLASPQCQEQLAQPPGTIDSLGEPAGSHAVKPSFLKEGELTLSEHRDLSWVAPSAEVIDYYRSAIHAFPLTGEFGNGSVPVVQALVGALDIPPGSHVFQGHGVGGYCRNNTSTAGGTGLAASATGTYCVGVLGQGTMTVPGGSVSGLTGVAANTPQQSAGKLEGLDFGSNVGVEADVNILTKADGSAPRGEAFGFFAGTGSDVQPSADFAAYMVSGGGQQGENNAPVPWKDGFKTRDGSASTGLNLGAGSNAPISGSQAILFNGRLSGGVPISSFIQLDQNGNMVMSSGTRQASTLLLDATGALAAQFSPKVALIQSLSGMGNRAVYATQTGILTNSSSDARLKTKLAAIDPSAALRQVLLLKPQRFNWIDTGIRGPQQEIGLIAQDVREVVPEIVGENRDGMLSIDYAQLSTILAAAVQAQERTILYLEVALAALTILWAFNAMLLRRRLIGINASISSHPKPSAS